MITASLVYALFCSATFPSSQEAYTACLDINKKEVTCEAWSAQDACVEKLRKRTDKGYVWPVKKKTFRVKLVK